MLTKRQKENYLKEPSKCPKCISDDIDVIVAFDGNNQGIQCLTCDFYWIDIYELVDIIENED
jgi:hypothetical protein